MENDTQQQSLMKTVNIKHICVWVLLAILPAISFANKQGFAAIKTIDNGSITDTVPATANKEEPLPEVKTVTPVKKVPKSRRQVKPLSLPEAAVKPVIKPKIIKPVVKVGL